AVLDAEKRQKLLESFLNNIPEAIVLLDSSHHIVEWNPGAEKMFGYLHEEVVGKNIDDLITDREYLKEAKKFTKRVLSGEAVYPHETVRYRKDGSPVNVIVSGSPVKIRGKLQGIVGIYIDISMKKKIEEELKKADKLESLAILAGGIAHDFNNILASILVNIGLFELYKDDDSKRVSKLKEMESAILRAKDLTQQLLTFSKGNAPIKNPASINELLEETVNFTLSGSNVKCDFHISENLREADIDKGQISQVIQNIIINAVQAMPEGGTISVSAENLDKKEIKDLPLNKNRYIRMEFKDRGIGVPESQLKNIFDPFFTTKQKGGGLGLATAFSIIKNHDGLITVESELGKSTTFCVYLPALKTKVLKKDQKENNVVSGKGKILLMDDDEMILSASGGLLEHLGYIVEEAKDGEEAIVLYKNAKNSQDPFDCVILDLTIPNGMGGKEVIKELLKNDPDVKAIATSGYSIDPIIADYKKFGFKGAIPKPYIIEELSMLINKILKE
ncbi:MAG: PAS domain S-box protein, partial [Candidatus Aminicenantes bacterium]|nr:PAS domain S-box protein [Candidatus Aminicenantes bacterium]